MRNNHKHDDTWLVIAYVAMIFTAGFVLGANVYSGACQ